MSKETRYAVEVFTASIVFFMCPVFYLFFMKKVWELQAFKDEYKRQELFIAARIIMIAAIIMWIIGVVFIMAQWILKVDRAIGVFV